MSKKSSTFAPAFDKTAGWMSDLVSGLQNRSERFDSATGLTEPPDRRAALILWTN